MTTLKDDIISNKINITNNSDPSKIPEGTKYILRNTLWDECVGPWYFGLYENANGKIYDIYFGVCDGWGNEEVIGNYKYKLYILNYYNESDRDMVVYDTRMNDELLIIWDYLRNCYVAGLFPIKINDNKYVTKDKK
jgi:hypothetical protein